VLAGLPEEDFAALAPFLEACEVNRGAGLAAGGRGEHVFFPETAILAVFSDGCSEVDLGPIGFEGVAGLSGLFGNSPFRFMVSAEGVCLRIPAAVLAGAIDRSEALRARLMRYEVRRQAEIAEIARANALCTVEERLARYLLAYGERSPADELNLTHGMLSRMLGVRRAGVTDALHLLEGKGAIRNTRRVVTIRDREMLRRISRCDSW
jgi:CRP-like cAMP-binding protein